MNCHKCGWDYSGLLGAVEKATGTNRHKCKDDPEDDHSCKNPFCQYPETEPCQYCKFDEQKMRTNAEKVRQVIRNAKKEASHD